MSLQFSHLLPPTFKEKVKEWIIEDVPSFDFGAAVVGDSEEEAYLYAKSNLSKQISSFNTLSSFRSSFC
jgi:nicotinate-nucleotide pyrophosphorylase (carboxylating)